MEEEKYFTEDYFRGRTISEEIEDANLYQQKSNSSVNGSKRKRS
jgi:hypothetical protein